MKPAQKPINAIFSLEKKGALVLRSFAISILATLSCAPSLFAEGRPLLGVQRWDMYSGKGATQAQELGYLPGRQGFLKPAEWHDRAHFFARLTADVHGVDHPEEAGPLWYNYPFSQERLQADMDQEIRYAHGANIDFFIYHGPARTLYPNGWELRNNLDAHMASTIPEAQQMKFVCALYGHPAINYNRSKVTLMMDDTIGFMTRPNWQTVMDGRPLLPVLWPDNFKEQLAAAEGDESMTASEFTAYIRARVQAAGLNNPYIVGMEVPARSFLRAAAWKEDGYDAFSDYSGGYGGMITERDEGATYAQATETLMEAWATDFVGQALPSIPPCSSTQYPWPRALDADNQPVDTWYHFQWPRKGDLAARVRAALNFVAAHPEDCEAQVIFMYSWNEHSEGGGICPTMGSPPEYEPDTRWLDEVAGALSGWKNNRIFTEGFNSDFTDPYSPTDPTTGAQGFGAQFGVGDPGIVATGNNSTDATEGDSFAVIDINASNTSPQIIGGMDIELGTVKAAGVTYTFAGDFGWRSGSIAAAQDLLLSNSQTGFLVGVGVKKNAHVSANFGNDLTQDGFEQVSFAYTTVADDIGEPIFLRIRLQDNGGVSDPVQLLTDNWVVTVTPQLEISSMLLSGNTASITISGNDAVPYHVTSSVDLMNFTTEENAFQTGTSTPLPGPFNTRFGIRTFDVDITGRTDRLFFRIQASDPDP